MFRRQLFTTASVLQYLQPIICGCSNVILLGLSYHEQTASLKCLHIMDHSSRTVHAHTNVFQSCENDFENWLAFQRDCLSSGEALVQQIGLHGRRQYEIFFYFFLQRQASLGLPFLLMSCHAMAFQGGNMFLCRRQSVQAGSNQIRHVIKSFERTKLTRSSGKQQRIKQFYKEQNKRLTPGRTDGCVL